MRNQLCVSTYSLRQLFGPVRLTFRGPDGKKAPFSWGEGEPSISLLDFPARVKAKLGLDAVEICQMHVPDTSPEYLARVKGALDDAGVSVVNVPIDVGNISDPNDAYREEDLAEIEDWIRAAAALGARMVRVNAGNPMAGEQAPIEVAIASYRRLGRLTESLGMQLLVENHGGRSSDPEHIIALIEAVGPTLRPLLDIGNFEPLASIGMARWQGKPVPTEIDLTPLYAAIERVAPYAALIHAKTHDFDEEGQPRDLDVVRALRLVRDVGFTGPISIEYEGTQGDPWENSRRTKELVEEAFA